MTTRAILYARVSRDEQRGNFSLATQIDACAKYAEEHGYEIVQIFREDFTGTQTRRPEMNKVLELANSRQIDVVIVYKVDRLTRGGAYPLGWFMTEFADHGVRVNFVIEPPDDSPEGKALAGFRASSAEREVKEIERRTKEGLRAKAKSGKPIGRARAPFGLRYKPPELDADGFPIKSTIKASYEPNPATIDALRWVFDQADRGVSLRKIARGLDELGVAPPYADRTKAKLWNATSVRHILLNRAYIGEGIQFAVKIEDHPDPGKQKRRVKRAIDPDGDGAIPLPPGVLPVVIDPERFGRVQRRLELNKRESQRDDRPAEFGLLRRGIARCGHCNSALRVNYNSGKDPGGREATYGCQTNQRRRHGCAPNDISLHKLDREVWGWIVALRDDPRLVERFTAHLREDDLSGEAARMLTMLDVQIAEIDKQRVTLTKRLGLVDDDTAALVADELGRLSTQRKAVVAQRERYSAKAEADEKRRARVNRTIELVKGIADSDLEALSYGQQRRILGDLGSVVLVWPNGHAPRWGMTLAFDNDRSRIRMVGDDQISVVWDDDDDFGEATFYLSSPRARIGTQSTAKQPALRFRRSRVERSFLPAPTTRAGW
jgi:DNA invertase Pin-like site-specific DNA recombinase